jgi:hypothetical protein
MRSTSLGVAAVFAVAALLGCSNSKSPTEPGDPISGPETPGGNPGGSPTAPAPDPGDTTGGDSTSGGDDEQAQGFLAWTLSVLPSGELQLHFTQTGLSVGSFEYTIGGTLDGDVQCYNKADNAPQGVPFQYEFTAGATLGATAVDGTVDATVTTAVMNSLCGSTKFYALPVTSARPFTWSGNYLANPEGTLALPEISLGDESKHYASN